MTHGFFLGAVVEGLMCDIILLTYIYVRQERHKIVYVYLFICL